MIYLLIYVVCALLTGMVASFYQGREQGRMRVLQPESFSVVNWPNMFFLCVLWPAHWLALFGRRTVRGESKTQAAINLGISPERVK